MAYTLDELAGSDTIDSRDLEERQDELANLDELTEDEAAELAELQALKADIGDEWPYGVTLIRESYFENYARELAEDIGAIDRDAEWPASYIDWPAAAEALMTDYSVTEIRGVTYYWR